MGKCIYKKIYFEMKCVINNKYCLYIYEYFFIRGLNKNYVENVIVIDILFIKIMVIINILN